MIKIEIPEGEFWNEKTQRFLNTPKTSLRLEHSLVSLSKWESHWEKSFINTTKKTREETLWYIRAMTLDEDVPDIVYDCLTDENIKQINNYIDSKQTATWFAENKNAKKSREIITAEIIYYWMISLNIPFECQHWHLERLITLIKVCDEKNAPKKKMSPSQVAQRNRTLNEQRRAQLKTSG